MAYKNKEDRIKYDKNYYLTIRKQKYIYHPLVKKTREEKLANKRAWYWANLEKAKAIAKKSREKHKEQRRLDYKLWVEKNKEHFNQYHREYSKRYFQINKEKYAIRNKIWLKNNPERAKEIIKKSKILHKEDIKMREKIYHKTLQGRYKLLRNSAVKRNKILELSFEEFCEIIKQPCNYCGETEKRIGIDRVDNIKGYTKENSAPCCNPCNMMKKTMSKDDFLTHIEKIYKYNS